MTKFEGNMKGPNKKNKLPRPIVNQRNIKGPNKK